MIENPPPPPDSTLRRPSVGAVSLLDKYEFWLSLEVLLFGLAIVVLQHFQVKGREIGVQDILRLQAVTLILVGSLFIITAGFDSNQIAPAMGLFGTVAGYLLGKSEKGDRT